MVDARYTNTQVEIKAIKDHLLKTTGSAPTTILRDEDDDEFIANDAKKGESGRDRLPKLDPFGCPPFQKGQSKRSTANKPGSAPAPQQTNDQTTANAESAKVGKAKEIDESANIIAEEAAEAKQKRSDTLEVKAEALVQKKQEQ